MLTGQKAKSLPAGLSSGLSGSRGVLIYQFNLAYQPVGKEVVRKAYVHAVHDAEGDSGEFRDVFPMTAAHAVDTMVEQVMLRFLRDLQKEGKL